MADGSDSAATPAKRRKLTTIPLDTGAHENSPAPSAGGLKHILHGIAYQEKLTIIILLHAAKLKREYAEFDFTVTCEDPEGGKFDDICFRFGCGGRRSELFVQAKHSVRETNDVITMGNLLSTSSQAPFPIGKCFRSFLDQQRNAAESLRELVLCTNVGVSEDVRGTMKKYEFRDACIKSIFESVRAEVYQFDLAKLPEGHMRTRIVKHLEEHSDFVCLAKQLANHIFSQKKIGLRKPIFKKYRFTIEQYIATNEPKETGAHVYKVNEYFLNGALQVNATEFKSAFEAEYQKLLPGTPDAVWRDVASKGILLTAGFYDRTVQPDDITDFPTNVTWTQMQAFFNSFVLVCNAIGEEALCDHIVDMLELPTNYFLPGNMRESIEPELAYVMLTSKTSTWMKQRCSSSLSSADIEAFFKYFVSSLHYLHLRGISNLYCTQLEAMGFRLEPSQLKTTRLHHALEPWLSEHIVHHYVYHPLIARQVLELFEHQYIFVEATNFNSMKDTFSDVFCAINFPLVLVIVFNSEFCQSDVEILQNWAQAKPLRQCQKKIIILHKPTSKPSEAAGDLLIRDLTNESREETFSRNEGAIFFGTTVPLEALVCSTDPMNFLVDLTSASEECGMRKNLITCWYEQIEKSYIQRKWQSCDTPTTEHSSETFWKRRNRNVLSDVQDAKALLEKASTKMCMKEFVELINHGRPTKKSIYEDPKRVLPPGAGRNNATKVFIFLNDAGQGKSYYLTWLARDLQVEHPSWWILKFNLIEYSTIFNENSDEKNEATIDETEALRILFQLTYLAFYAPNINRRAAAETAQERSKAKECAGLLAFSGQQVTLDDERMRSLSVASEHVTLLRMFVHKFNNKEMVILFDGFDEIAPHYKAVGLALLSRLAELDSVRKMYLSSRPYDFRKDFQDAFRCCRFIRLKKLWRDDKKKFLHRQLLNTIDEYAGYDAERRNGLMRLLTKLTDNLLGDLSCVPLFLAMALETFVPLIKAHMDLKKCTIAPEVLTECESIFELQRMMEAFVDRKLSIATTEKTGSTDTAAQIAAARLDVDERLKRSKRIHCILALYLLMDEADRLTLLSDEEQSDAREYMEKVDNGSEKSGIVEGVVDNVPMFIHRLFAEYFAAHWLLDNLHRDDVEAYVKRCLFENDDRKEVRQFLDRMVCRQLPLHLAVLDGSKSNVRKILEADPSTAQKVDLWGRTPLHLTVMYFKNRLDYMELLAALLKVQTGADIDRNDELLGRSAIDYAFALGKDDYLKHHLLEKGASVNTDALLNRLLASDPMSTLCNASAFENELMNLTEWCLSQSKANLLFERVAEQLIRHNRIDPYHIKYRAKLPDPLPKAMVLKLKRLGMASQHTGSFNLLEICAVLDAASLLKNLVKSSEKRKLARFSTTLVKVAMEYCSVHVLQYLIIERQYKLPGQIAFQELVRMLMFCIKENAMHLFKFLFDKYCTEFNVDCLEESKLSTGCASEATDDEEEWMDSCDWLKLPAVPNEFKYTERGTDIGTECLLIEAIEVNNRKAIVYLVQKVQLAISSGFLVSLFTSYKIGWHCERGVDFLLDRATDLRGIDGMGRNLLHVAAQHGWYCLAKCLIEHYNFDAMLTNGSENNWNAFFYCVAEVGSKYGSQKILTFMAQRYSVDCFQRKDTLGKNVFYYAVKNNRLIAEYIVQRKCIQLAERTFLDRSTILRNLLQKSGLEPAEITSYSQSLAKLLPGMVARPGRDLRNSRLVTK